ncbi:MAG: Na+/H+ antiporter subunit G [Bradyrhizobiaceae bacterium]|nr:MAG: Na+/H+ antiporter subunit G [Bradyrhizobiaceae bacterium]
MILDIATLVLASAGVVFFIAGTLGLLRFPDVYARLHALTKADNLGLGLIALGLVLQAGNVWQALKIVLVWLLAIFAAATVSQLIARSALVQRSSSPAARDS